MHANTLPSTEAVIIHPPCECTLPTAKPEQAMYSCCEFSLHRSHAHVESRCQQSATSISIEIQAQCGRKKVRVHPICILSPRSVRQHAAAASAAADSDARRTDDANADGARRRETPNCTHFPLALQGKRRSTRPMAAADGCMNVKAPRLSVSAADREDPCVFTRADRSASLVHPVRLLCRQLRAQLRGVAGALGVGLLDGQCKTAMQSWCHLLCRSPCSALHACHAACSWLNCCMHCTRMQVKNVTGRKLVGLRWWNEANDSGSAWRFESAPEVSRGLMCVGCGGSTLVEDGEEGTEGRRQG